MAQMTEAEWREFVMTGTLTGKLAVVRADGARNGVPGELLVRLRPTSVVAQRDVSA
jgi:hypothetical protein